MITKTERGWAGHFCGSNNCGFRRNTLLTHAKTGKRVIISTVGNYQTDLNDITGMTTLGLDRYYETMVFNAIKQGEYWEINTRKEISFENAWSINQVTVLNYIHQIDLLANNMHEVVVNEITERLKNGDI